MTVVLGMIFWLPLGNRKASLASPARLEGKTWVLREPAPPAVERPAAPQPPAATPPAKREAKRTAPPAAATERGMTRSAPSQPAASAAVSPSKVILPVAAAPQALPTAGDKAAPKDQPEVQREAPAKEALRPSSPSGGKETSDVALSAVAPTDTLDPLQRYTMQDLVDGFESDPSKYPLDRTLRSDGIALTLEGLQRRDKLCVLKVAVANATDADFFVKEFAVRAGATILGSRSLFRILVEPHRSREGYVVFERPPSGAAVQIKLKEDGGKGRSVDAAVPYRF